MNEIELHLTIEEANLILEALGEMPFARVYGLVAKLQEQASEQIGNDGPALVQPPEEAVADGE